MLSCPKVGNGHTARALGEAHDAGDDRIGRGVLAISLRQQGRDHFATGQQAPAFGGTAPFDPHHRDGDQGGVRVLLHILYRNRHIRESFGGSQRIHHRCGFFCCHLEQLGTASDHDGEATDEGREDEFAGAHAIHRLRPHPITQLEQDFGHLCFGEQGTVVRG